MEKLFKRNVVIISSGQPSANPRLVKEAKALVDYNCNVTVVYCPISKWADNFDIELIRNNPDIQWICVGSDLKYKNIFFFYVKLRRKIWSLIYWTFGNYLDSAIKSSVLFSQEIRKRSLKIKADIIIGHNIGAIKAVVDVANKYNGIACFDFVHFQCFDPFLSSPL